MNERMNERTESFENKTKQSTINDYRYVHPSTQQQDLLIKMKIKGGETE